MKTNCAKLLCVASLALASLTHAAEANATEDNTAPVDLLRQYAPTNAALADNLAESPAKTSAGVNAYSLSNT